PRHAFAAAWAADRASEPLSWNARSRWYASRNDLSAFIETLAELGRIADTTPVHPFSDPTFLAALGDEGGRWGWTDRAAAIAAVMGDVVPRWILEREDKAEFSGPTWDAEAGEFCRSWSSDGIEDAIVDNERLRREWS